MEILGQIETIDEAYGSSVTPSSNGRVVPRWKRKIAENRQTYTPNIQPRAAGKLSTHKSDRFIPNRNAMDAEKSNYSISSAADDFDFENSSSSILNADSSAMDGSKRSAEYEEKLQMLRSKSKVLAFKNKAPAPKLGTQNALKVIYSQNKNDSTKKKNGHRHILKMPLRSLDLPNVVDDYYLNILDWSQENIIGVGVSNSVYLWHASSGAASQLLQTEDEDNIITSLKFSADGSYVGVGFNDNSVHIVDVESSKKLRVLDGHNARISSLSWNGPVITTGSADSTIINHDVRIQNHQVSILRGHTQEVCGLKWSSGGEMLASGANDNLVKIWDSKRTDRPKFVFTEHKAAVKAMDWSPWQRNLLATGGGMADRHIHFWNTATGKLLSSIDTESQVSSVAWSKNSYELVSAHGFNKNKLSVWKYPSLTNIADLHGHSGRIFHMCLGPDGRLVASVAGDETMRIWNVFEQTDRSSKNKTSSERAKSRDLGRSMHIR